MNNDTEQTAAAEPAAEETAPAAVNGGAPDLKCIISAMLFAAKKPLPVAEICRVLQQVAETLAIDGAQLPAADADEVRRILAEITETFRREKLGLALGIAPGPGPEGGGYRLQTDPACGPWLRCLLELGKPTRLSRPALETLAIIAYRQPITRAEIEGVRGVNVDAIMRTLLEMQLIKIVGRSDLPGRPLLYGTTQLFLEHFGLKDVRDLPGIEQLCRQEMERARAAAAQAADAETAPAAPAPAALAEAKALETQPEQNASSAAAGNEVQNESG